MDISLNSTYTYAARTNGYNKNTISENFKLREIMGNSIEKVDELSEGKVLGIGFIKDSNGNNSYGMAARYAETSTTDNPIV